MKIFIFFLLMFPHWVFSQKQKEVAKPYPRFQISTGYGMIYMINDRIGEKYSDGWKAGVNYNIHLSGIHYLSVGIGYEANRHLLAGYFTKENNQYEFERVPDEYDDNELSLQYLDFPVLYKLHPRGPAALNIGFFTGYLLDSKSKYKLDGLDITEHTPVENKFRWGMLAEAEFLLFSAKNRFRPTIGTGLQYQPSRHLKNAHSFNPFLMYFKLGLAIR